MNAVEINNHYENMVRQEWTNTITVGAWNKWSREQAIHCQPLTDALIRHAELEPGQKVLDLACGVGQPSISIAQDVLPQGSVVATDLSAGMLEVAKSNAAKVGVQNIEFKTADAHDLPFADNSFDRVVSRLGIMYFWDVEGAIAEIARVLRPGGVASFVVWGAPENNEYFSTILMPFMKRREMPMPPADAPTPGRFGDVSALAGLFERTGFSKVGTQEYVEPLPWPGTPGDLYRHFYDMAAPLQPYIDSFPLDVQQQVLREVEQGFEHVWDGDFTRASASFNAVFVVK